ncbi:hypothetical protein [Roseomonas gilardii]|uniref:hypothetical protein n=1 Tax=Roseomonas gilardii TaxID=257708 RepID=UPI0012DC48D0|nr:hypothetical protein [Roseomonas gilardii]
MFGRCLRAADFLVLFLLPFIVMPLDGEEHARAQHDNLECEEDYRKPIPHLNISRLLFVAIYREKKLLRTDASATSLLFKPSGPPLIFWLACNQSLGGFGYAK